MITSFEYDTSFQPPAPVAPVRIANPAGGDSVLLPMLVDTGSDCTLVPASVVRQLGLPPADFVAVLGVTGGKRRAVMHAAALEFGDLSIVARVVSFSHEALLGRDVLNQLLVTLDGLTGAISIRQPRPRRRRQRR